MGILSKNLQLIREVMRSFTKSLLLPNTLIFDGTYTYMYNQIEIKIVGSQPISMFFDEKLQLFLLLYILNETGLTEMYGHLQDSKVKEHTRVLSFGGVGGCPSLVLTDLGCRMVAVNSYPSEDNKL